MHCIYITPKRNPVISISKAPRCIERTRVDWTLIRRLSYILYSGENQARQKVSIEKTQKKGKRSAIGIPARVRSLLIPLKVPTEEEKSSQYSLGATNARFIEEPPKYSLLSSSCDARGDAAAEYRAGVVRARLIANFAFRLVPRCVLMYESERRDDEK